MYVNRMKLDALKSCVTYVAMGMSAIITSSSTTPYICGNIAIIINNNIDAQYVIYQNALKKAPTAPQQQQHQTQPLPAWL